jgi:outer membrane protein insertion porin family
VFQESNTLRHSIFLILFTTGGFFLTRSFAVCQGTQAETYQILGVSVEGNNPQGGTESSAIIANSGLKVGGQISVPGDQTRQAIQQLWALHIFSDIQILIENKVASGVFLLIKVREYPRLERVEISGTDDVSKDDVMKKVTE